MKTTYPFSAVVASHDVKLALILAALDPRISGVLIEGEKGTAKTTLARGLGALLPEGGSFVELPLGTTEDRLKGSIDLVGLVKEHEARLHQGLLGAAHGGILYVDEVNLLADHLVDMILDAAATGENRVERDSISVVEPSDFVLVGSMNREEGWLRPQLLDRFGLFVRSSAIGDVSERMEATRRRLAFDADPERFAEEFALGEAEISAKLAEARRRSAVSRGGLLADLDEKGWEEIAARVSEMGVGSLRADLVLVRAACAYAFWVGDRVVRAEHVACVAPFVFAHRSHRRQEPQEQANAAPGSGSRGRSAPGNKPAPSSEGPEAGPPSPGVASRPYESGDFALGGARRASGVISGADPTAKPAKARRVAASKRPNPKVVTYEQGAVIGSDRLTPDEEGALDALATARHAIARIAAQREDGSSSGLEMEDLRRSLKLAHQARLVVVVLDASGSMGLERRIAAAREVLVSVLEDSYERRNRVSLVSFAGDSARALVSSARSVEMVERKLNQLRSGGLSPLAAGLRLGRELAMAGRKQGLSPEVVVISDGRATGGVGDPVAEAAEEARELARAHLSGTFVDLDVEVPSLGLMKRFAQLAEARVVAAPPVR